MSKDAFDRFWDWREKPLGSNLMIPAEVYHSVMSLPEPDRIDRRKVNETVRKDAEARRTGKVVWLYFNSAGGRQRQVGDPEWAKVFASGELADKWLERNDPEGVAWEYKIEGKINSADTRKGQRAVWIYAKHNGRQSAADPDNVRVFASQPEADKWRKKHDPDGKISEYAVLTR